MAALQRQKILGLITHRGVDFWYLLERAEMPRGELRQLLHELRDCGEIQCEQRDDDGVLYPIFRRSTLWDAGRAA